jgi:hypothetical protein
MEEEEHYWAPSWSDATRDEWIDDYLSGRPVLMPHVEHGDGECEHCDVLRSLMRRADEEQER